MDAKAAKMRERFEKRQEARLAKLQRKKASSTANKVDGDNVVEFNKKFTEELNNITKELDDLKEGQCR